MKKGFSLLEVLLVVGIAAIIFTFTAPLALNFYRTQLINEAQSDIVDALLTAERNAVLQKNDSAFGVTLSEVPNAYVLFQGPNYGGRDATQDEIFPVISNITFSGLTDVVFSKLTGLPNATGTSILTYGSLTRKILVEDSGSISDSN